MNKEINNKVVTRFAPSPTGLPHMGNIRTGLFSYIFARQNSGKFVLRIEDTDKERSKKEYENDIVEGIKWLGLSYDEFFRQSGRTGIYENYLKKLIESGKAYVSKEKVEKDSDREEVIRFKNPNIRVKFTDLIRGEVEFDTTDLGDFVIAKSMTEPVFHLAVVVDDFEMGITHVIRGEDHISNTPRQILIQEAIGATRPIYAHLPLVLAPDKSKLSKRKHGEMVSLSYYIKQGYLPEAIVNFIALIGWNPGTEQELLSLDDLIKQFDISKMQKGGAIFNVEKLDWINKEYIKRMTAEQQKGGIMPFVPEYARMSPIIDKILGLIVERINAFGEVKVLFESGELDYFFKKPEFPKEKLLWKGAGDLKATAERLKKVYEILDSLEEKDFELAEKIKNSIWNYATEQGRGEVLWPFRFALSGKEKSPDPFVLAGILGKKETLERINDAVGKINE